MASRSVVRSAAKVLGVFAVVSMLLAGSFKGCVAYVDRSHVKTHLLLDKLPASVRNVECDNQSWQDYYVECSFGIDGSDISEIISSNEYICKNADEVVLNDWRVEIEDLGVNGTVLCSGGIAWYKGKALTVDRGRRENSRADNENYATDHVKLAFNADRGRMRFFAAGDL